MGNHRQWVNFGIATLLLISGPSCKHSSETTNSDQGFRTTSTPSESKLGETATQKQLSLQTFDVSTITTLPTEKVLAKNICLDLEKKRLAGQELSVELQKCLDGVPGKILALEPGTYRISKKIDLKSNRGLTTNSPDTTRCAEEATHSCA